MPKLKPILLAASLAGASIANVATAEPARDMFWVRTTQKAPEAVAGAIKAFAESNKWLYLAEFKLRGGQITAVKICYPAIAPDIFAAGTHVAAMMPCGNIAIYLEQGRTTVSMLHPRFMSALVPHERMAKAVRVVTPLFETMLETVLK